MKLQVPLSMLLLATSHLVTEAAPPPTAGGGPVVQTPPDVSHPPADAVKTPSGLSYKILKRGSGTNRPLAADTVFVHYSGWTTDGKLFDSSVQRNQVASFNLNGVIKGWTEGLQLMVEGERCRFWVPASLAYGERPAKNAPKGMLVFDIELLSINAPPKAADELADIATVETDGDKTRIEVLKEQGPNCAEWALAPLDEAIPENIRQNLVRLREDLLDEGKSEEAKSGPEAYKQASLYCDKILTALDQREMARAKVGYRSAQADANRATGNSALNARRNYKMSWPQYAREESQRAALRTHEVDKASVNKEGIRVEWSDKASKMRVYLDTLYRKFRELLR